MSGFLSRLIGRTRETAEVLRPRVASLFEPGEAARQVETGFESVVDAPVESEMRRTPVPLRRALHVEAAPVASVQPQWGKQEEERTERVARVPRQAEPESEHRAVANPQVHMEAGEQKPATLWRVRRPVFEESERAKPKEHEPVLEVREGVQKPAVREQLNPAEARMATVREDLVNVLPVQRIFAQSAAPSLVVPKQRPQFEAAQSLPRVPASEPVVEVTIGRIEVRAVAEAKGHKARANPAVMGLDEYLKTRGRGGRP
jgi:hypothetical protein